MTTFVEPRTAKQYQCGICSSVMTEPRQFNCAKGDLFCQNCINGIIVIIGRRQCPSCKEECEVPFEYVKIPFIERQIRGLKVLCPNRTIPGQSISDDSKRNETFGAVSNDSKKRKIITTDGNPNKRAKLNNEVFCDWNGTFGELDPHKNECKFQLLDCAQNCETVIFRKDITEHYTKCPNTMIKCKCLQSLKRAALLSHTKLECPDTTVRCQYCEVTFLRKESNDHWPKCPKLEIVCPNDNCDQKMERRLMAAHVQNVCPRTKVSCEHCLSTMMRTSVYGHQRRRCKEITVNCAFSEKGCSVAMKRKELEQHKQVCQFRTVKCGHCGNEMFPGELVQHKKVCQFAPVKCEHCGNEMFRKDLSNHVKNCTYVVIKCKCSQSFKRMLMEWHINNYCTETVIDCTQCGLKVKRGSISEHKKSECKEAMVECRFVENGCNAEVKRKELEQHTKVCQFASVKCEHCGNEMVRKDLSDHVKECTHVMIKCKCSQSFKRMLMEWHINHYCTETVIDCTQCGLKMKRGSISEHKKSECKEAMVECRFVEYGCNEKVKRKDLEIHSKECMGQHLNMVKDTCDDLKESYRKLESKCDEYGEKIDLLMSQISSSGAPAVPPKMTIK